ncbi:MAG: sensor histidine kinase [Pirellulales bacterium]|nr:sensor histidine kinase [Pirellulales bacterium]
MGESEPTGWHWGQDGCDERRLLRELLAAHEQERQLLAYEIHDGLAQDLTGALLRLQAFRELLKRNPDEGWAVFAAGVELLTKSVEHTRGLIASLRPPILDESGIVAAVDYLVCEGRRGGGPRIEFEHDVPAGRMPASMENAVFRIVQEALTNARRHSQSEKIRVELRQKEGGVVLEARDWGVGFDPRTVTKRRLGLRIIHERARSLGGRVVIESAPGKGVHVRVELPAVGEHNDADRTGGGVALPPSQ